MKKKTNRTLMALLKSVEGMKLRFGIIPIPLEAHYKSTSLNSRLGSKNYFSPIWGLNMWTIVKNRIKFKIDNFTRSLRHWRRIRRQLIRKLWQWLRFRSGQKVNSRPPKNPQLLSPCSRPVEHNKNQGFIRLSITKKKNTIDWLNIRFISNIRNISVYPRWR
jgi:hypothetical protein